MSVAKCLHVACIAWLLSACSRIPTPLEPGRTGSIGLPHRGVLKNGRELPRDGGGYHFLRDNDRHSALPRFASVLERAAKSVSEERANSTLVIGDVSPPSGGGPLLPHFSHRSGRDADLLLYLTTLDGAPIQSPGFVPIGADGIGQDSAGFYRLDVEREWLLVRALLTDPEARVQWIFVHDGLKAKLLDWAVARGEPMSLLSRAQQVMAQPKPGGLHDDHIHVRTACDAAEVAAGCEAFGPERPWLAITWLHSNDSNEELARALLSPLDPAQMASSQ